MRTNGLMIDCSRLMELHDYYFRLIDFMSEWGMDKLLLHCADDHDLGVRLPGHERLAMGNAFTEEEIRQLCSHAERKGIDLFPEIEVFGHTKYLTTRDEFRHLFAGDHFEECGFSAVDPLNPQTEILMRSLLQAAARLFSSDFLHIGCDEVGMKNYCREKDLDEARTWADYVNTMIGIVFKINEFHAKFADRVFGLDLSTSLNEYLVRWPAMGLPLETAPKLLGDINEISEEELQKFKKTLRVGEELERLSEEIHPPKNLEIWDGMRLAARAAAVCSESAVLRLESNVPKARKVTHNKNLQSVREAMSQEWDHTRFPDDHQKHHTIRNETDHQYVMILLDKLPEL